MRRWGVSPGQIIGVAVIVVIPLAIHIAIAYALWAPLIIAIPLAELLLIAAIAAYRRPALIKWLLPMIALLGLIWFAGGFSWVSAAAIPGIPHALAYSSLLFVFGSSLLPGREAILTRAVGAVRGPLPPEIVAHTRRVTAVWCGFFAGQLIGSLILFIWAPIETWSFFINVLNLPLVVALFVIEWAYRTLFYRHYPQDTLSDVVRIVAKTRLNRTRQADSV